MSKEDKKAAKKQAKLNKKEDSYKEKIDQLEDRVKRQMAEFENFRKRTDKEKQAMFDTGAKSVIEKILPVVDNFERGLATVPEESKEDRPFNFLPTCLQDGLSFRCEGMACTIQYHRDRLKAVRLAGGAKEPHGDQRQNIPFPGRESRQVRPGDLHGGNNGMVVGDFTAIRYPVNIRFFQASFPERHVVPQPHKQINKRASSSFGRAPDS